MTGTGTITRRGKSIIAAEESHSSVSYGLLHTPDRVRNVTLPTDGLIIVAYQALVKSDSVAAQAAIFLGPNQVKAANPGFVPGGQSALEPGLSPDVYKPLGTFGGGLQMAPANTDTGTAVTTGQIVGGVVGGSNGGLCALFAAPGTYDVSIQFRSSSGTVTVKDRKLWVWTVGF